MKKDCYYSLGIFLAFNVVLFNTTTHANSSWYWISETRPFDILPWVAIATIIIETLSINYVGRIHRLYKVFGITILANMVSFLVPYFLHWTDTITHLKYPLFSDMIENDHIYTVSVLYFLLTILAEAPIVYFVLRKDAGIHCTKRLLTSIVFSNLVTTIMVAVIERIICQGSW